jgi:hypothetical protein
VIGQTRSIVVLFASATTAFLSGCSTAQVYGAGQAWQRVECSKINDAQERTRCMASTSTSYEDYMRQVEAAKGTK